MRKSAWRVAVLLAAAALAGASYQAIGNHFDTKRRPEPGRLVDAGGVRLLLHCTGQGSPTVVLESGLGDLANEWRHVQPEIAKRSRVCSYDRAGYGGSDAGPVPRTSRRIATELHALLRNAGETPPFILVGHSFGGYNVRVYNSQFPNQVTGMILVDSTQEDQYKLLPESWKRMGAELRRRYRSQAFWSPVFIDMGVARLTLGGMGEHGYLLLQSKYLKARASELENIEISAEQARAAGTLGDKPLIVLTAGKNPDAEFQRVWADDLQMRLVRLSSRGERILLHDSGHDIPNDRPDAIVNAVERMGHFTQ